MIVHYALEYKSKDNEIKTLISSFALASCGENE